MKRTQGLSGAALALILGIWAAGCAPKEEPAAPEPAPSARAEKPEAAAGAKIVTATLKAAGMT